MSPIISLIMIALLALAIFVFWFRSAVAFEPAKRKIRRRPTIQQAIEAAGGRVVSLDVDHDSEVFACEVVYIDQFGEKQTRHAIEHQNYRPNVGNGGYYWNRPIRSSMIEANVSAEQRIIDLDAEVKRLQKTLTEIEAKNQRPPT